MDFVKRTSVLIILNIFLVSSAIAQSNLELLSSIFPDKYQELFRNLKNGNVKKDYEFDVRRTPEQALKEGLGARCNMHARVAAYALMQQGVPAKDLRIVSAVENSALDALCKGRKGKAVNQTNNGLRGHVFLLIKSENKWYLVNTTTVPGSPPAQPFGKLGLEFISFYSPEELEEKIKKEPLAVPQQITGTLPPTEYGPMTFFHSVQPDKYPDHDFLSGRPKLIASGTLESDICRYNGAPTQSNSPSSTNKH